MKKLFLIALLLGSCAPISPEVKRKNATRALFCNVESCPAFAQIHNYTLLLSRYDEKGACVCTLMSDNMPDQFEVSIPVHADADSPVVPE